MKRIDRSPPKGDRKQETENKIRYRRLPCRPGRGLTGVIGGRLGQPLVHVAPGVVVDPLQHQAVLEDQGGLLVVLLGVLTHQQQVTTQVVQVSVLREVRAGPDMFRSQRSGPDDKMKFKDTRSTEYQDKVPQSISRISRSHDKPKD